MRRVEEILIGSTFTAMAAGDVNTTTLTAGTLVAYDQDRDGNITNTDRYFSIAQADLDFQSKQSMDIFINQIKKVTKKAYAAATNQISTLTIDAGDVANNRAYSLYICPLNNPDFVTVPNQLVQITSGGAATTTTIAAQFAAAINANLYLPVTATSGVAVLTITSKTSSDPFLLVRGDGLSISSAIATTQQADPGSGTLAQVRTHENYHIQYKGNINRTLFKTDYKSYVNAAAGYVQYTITHARSLDRDTLYDGNTTVSTTVYIDKDAAGVNFTNFEAIFTAIGVPITVL